MTRLPRLFALTRDIDDSSRTVGYGMVLPDGSAHSVSWPHVLGGNVWSTSNAEEAAELRNAEIFWIGDD